MSGAAKDSGDAHTPPSALAQRFCSVCGALTSSLECPLDGGETFEIRGTPRIPKLAPGTELLGGRYTVLGRLGSGGMGSVYLARQAHPVPRQVAVKVVADHEDRVERFFSEARALSTLSHPNVVAIHEFAVDPKLGLPLLVMGFVDGMTLRAFVKKNGTFSSVRLIEITRQIARALAAAHAAHIVHRDLKPDNVIVSQLPDGSDHVTVVDFGIAKSLGEPLSNQTITMEGSMVGTPYFMSPEQVSGKPVTPQSDLYALGCIVYFLASGKPPFVRDSVPQVLVAHVEAPIPEMEFSNLGTSLRELCRRLLAKRPSERPATASDVIEALQDASGVWPTEASAGFPTDLAPSTAPGLTAPSTAPGLAAPSTAPGLAAPAARRRAIGAALILLLLVVAGGLVGLGWLRLREAQGPIRVDARAVPSPSEASLPPPEMLPKPPRTARSGRAPALVSDREISQTRRESPDERRPRRTPRRRSPRPAPEPPETPPTTVVPPETPQREAAASPETSPSKRGPAAEPSSDAPSRPPATIAAPESVPKVPESVNKASASEVSTPMVRLVIVESRPDSVLTMRLDGRPLTPPPARLEVPVGQTVRLDVTHEDGTSRTYSILPNASKKQFIFRIP